MVKEIMKQQPLSSRKRCIHRDTFWYRIENKKMVVLASLLGNELGLDVDMKYINNKYVGIYGSLEVGETGGRGNIGYNWKYEVDFSAGVKKSK